MSVEKKFKQRVLVIGAGLAGSDAAWFLAENGVSVTLLESKKIIPNPSQKIGDCAELVCTNSLKSTKNGTAHGLLKEEMRDIGSLVISSGMESAVPAGDSLAVDRQKFSKLITDKLKGHSLIDLIDEEVVDPLISMKKYGCDYVILASGPLTCKKLETWILSNISKDDFYFYDAIAPVVDADSLDFSKLYYKDRYSDDRSNADYLNSPMNKEEYYRFIDHLVNAEKTPSANFEEYKFFESCLPIDIMAERGKDTASFSCMKPVGLELEDGTRPYAVVQLRKENLLGTAFNLVGFQNRLTYPEQKRVFCMIPGLENANFFKLGSVHRNSFLHSKKLLNSDMSSKNINNLYFAGQITGVEGYTESAASGLYVAFGLLRRMKELPIVEWPKEMAIGALINYIMTASKPIPSNINFGLLPTVVLSLEERKNKNRKRIKKELACQKARTVAEKFWQEQR